MKKEISTYDNGFFEFLESEEEFVVNNQNKLIKRTMVRRPPGIRALIVNDKNQILLSNEFRYELNDWDYRLPGGKVFDSLKDYKLSLDNNSVMDNVLATVPKEVLEEVGLKISNPKLIKVSRDGSGVIWDLYYFEIKDYVKSETGPQLEENEIINGYSWFGFEEIVQMCGNGSIHEDRTVGILLSYILNQANN